MAYVNPVRLSLQAIASTEMDGGTYPCGGQFGEGCVAEGLPFLKAAGFDTQLGEDIGIMLAISMLLSFLFVRSLVKWNSKNASFKLKVAVVVPEAEESDVAVDLDQADVSNSPSHCTPEDRPDMEREIPVWLAFQDVCVRYNRRNRDSNAAEGTPLAATSKSGSSRNGGDLTLNHVAGIVAPREMVAVLGPSGSGKSTLLNVLAGLNIGDASVTGMVCANGHVLSNGLVGAGLARFVPQNTQDELLEALTVRESVTFAARLQLHSRRHSNDQKLARVEEALNIMGLSDAAEVRVMSLSGGQHKRTVLCCSILVGDIPGVVLLDEVTSGLSAFDGLALCRVLRQLADRTLCSILMTTHSPRAAAMSLYDKVLTLTSDGRVGYFGSVDEAGAMLDGFGARLHALGVPRVRNGTDEGEQKKQQEGREANIEDDNIAERLLKAATAVPNAPTTLADEFERVRARPIPCTVSCSILCNHTVIVAQ